jgi:tetratricopeptide (TPR) repeat protein
VTTLVDRANRLYTEGVAASDTGRPALAARRLRAALRLLAANPPAARPAHADVRSRILMSLAWAESELGHTNESFRLLDEAERAAAAAQRPVLQAQRALLLWRTGRLDLALVHFDAALTLLGDESKPLDLVKALNNRSQLHVEAGRPRQARADLLRCRDIADRHGFALIGAAIRVNLGCLHVLAGDLPAALRAFTAARHKYDTLAPGRLGGLAVERARALLAAGLFGEADRELANAAEQAARQGQGYLHAEALEARAEAALLAGRPAAAADLARQARTAFLGHHNARRATLASLLALRAEWAAAAPADNAGGGASTGVEVAGRARALATRLGRLGLPEDARVAGLLAARTLIVAGRVRTAEQIAGQHGPPGRADRLDTRLLWRLTRADLATAGGRRAEASRHLVAGMATLHRYRVQLGCLDLQTGASVHGADLVRAGLDAALASGSPAAVYRWSERARAQALLLPPVHPPQDPDAAAALEELRQVRQSLREAELAGRPAGSMRARAETLQRTVREHSWSAVGPGTGTGPGPAPTPLGEVRSELADAALVAYVRAGPALHALVVAGRSITVAPIGSYAHAEEAVLRLRADLDTQAGRAMPRRLADAVAATTTRDAGALAAAVLNPILHLVSDRDLVVVPTGVLVTVPWAVLAGDRSVTVAPSAAAWLAARRRNNGGAGALLVAGPGNARGEAEVLAIADLRPGATVLTGPAATPTATLAALDGVELAHLAAHGNHEPQNALFSRLDLAGGPLMGYDLQRMSRTPPMVVLSSCDLGLTDVRPGDETFGMATALLTAGSSTVVASVTRVADETAMAMMTGFHAAVGAGRPPADALAAAVPPGVLSSFVCFGTG